jgi:hypothetical protein
MSSNVQSSQLSNKKQRRKNARARVQPTQPSDNEHEEIDQIQAIVPTQNSHQQLDDLSLVANGIEGLVLNVTKQVDDVYKDFKINIFIITLSIL